MIVFRFSIPHGCVLIVIILSLYMLSLVDPHSNLYFNLKKNDFKATVFEYLCLNNPPIPDHIIVACGIYIGLFS